MKLGDWYAFCDICGRRCLASETTRLSSYTGRGGLIVCKDDIDHIDPGLIPYSIPIEKPTKYARINHTNITNGTPVYDFDGGDFIVISTSQGEYISTSQGDLLIL